MLFIKQRNWLTANSVRAKELFEHTQSVIGNLLERMKTIKGKYNFFHKNVKDKSEMSNHCFQTILFIF